jgi:hypothetical protein
MVFVIVSLFLNTRIGEELETALIGLLGRLWQRISIDLLPGIFRFVMYFSRLFIESVDRALYEVDEWLRFRTGDSRWTLIVKPVLGFFWFFLTYIVRFGINVLLEPQINPIKHFPVVTVSHKLVMPLFVPPFTKFLSNSMEKALAGTVAFSVGTAIPGAFGFLVWEFKENWRLYEATRPATLRPVLIGHHGETMLRFLKPGFHSGTIPKLFAKLRKAAPSAHRHGDWKSLGKHRESLHHVAETIRRFIDREFVFLLNECTEFKIAPLTTREIDLATNRIQVELLCPKLSPASLVIAFAIQNNSLVTWIGQQGWLEHLSSRQSQVLQIAFTGLCKMAGVDLFIFPGNFLRESKNREVYFENLDVSWQDWVSTWERGPKGVISQTPGSLIDTLPECAG